MSVKEVRGSCYAFALLVSAVALCGCSKSEADAKPAEATCPVFAFAGTELELQPPCEISGRTGSWKETDVGGWKVLTWSNDERRRIAYASVTDLVAASDKLMTVGSALGVKLDEEGTKPDLKKNYSTTLDPNVKLASKVGCLPARPSTGCKGGCKYTDDVNCDLGFHVVATEAEAETSAHVVVADVRPTGSNVKSHIVRRKGAAPVK